MEKTIRMMKKNGLFDNTVHEILEHDLPKEVFASAIDRVCEFDENFEDTFFNDLHELGLCIIWKELCAEANRIREAEVQKQETIEDLLKKIIDLMSK